ncbi:hypothetical protein FWC31_03540 [Candidatus Saccharibacteria bacterium]|nr:hypothetical protein [Candidatus Saccharibacteria bacterium]
MSKISKIVAAAAVFGVIGLAALPMTGYALTQDVTVEIEVENGLSIGNGTDGCAVTNYAHPYGPAGIKADSSGDASEADPGCITIFSNYPGGYKLTLADKDACTGLDKGVACAAGDIIPTQANKPIAGTPGWAVAVTTTPVNDPSLITLGGTPSWLAMPAQSSTPITLHSGAGASFPTGDNYGYAFATAISAATATGVYTDTVTFTAVAN